MMLYAVLCVCACLLLLSAGYRAWRYERGGAWCFLPVVLATVALEICDLLVAATPDAWSMWKRGGVAAESLLPGAWLLFAFRRCRADRHLTGLQWTALALTAFFPATALSTPAVRFFYAPDIAVEPVLFLLPEGYRFYTLMILPLTFALAAMESTVRSASGAARWKIKVEFLAAGLLVAVLVFYPRWLTVKNRKLRRQNAGRPTPSENLSRDPQFHASASGRTGSVC